MLELFWRFMLVSLLAFGGGQAALPLIERTAVNDTGWIPAQDFSTAVAFGYITPGPVLITATFIGYRMGGLGGALVATLGIFMMPWLLAAGAARILRPFMQRPWLRGFGRGAAPAVVGLLGVTALSLATGSFSNGLYGGITCAALLLSLLTNLHPLLILAGGALLGALMTGG